MTGLEHYQEAARLVEAAGEIPSNHDDTNPAAIVLLAEAQVHATLALAAATALTAAKRPVVFDMADDELFFVVSEALEDWAAAQREKARHEGGSAMREQWAVRADQAREQVKAAFHD